MNQEIRQIHRVDDRGDPAGGAVLGTGIKIDWQNGPLNRGDRRVEPNGAFVDGVISAAIGRLEFYQGSKFKCRENSLAITKLQEALHWLDHRTKDRERLSVEGTHETRESEG